MKKQISLILLAVFVSSTAFSQSVVRDDNKANQWKSMVYKQWKFTPDYYYYSWITKWVLGIKIKVPGLGIHDNGAGGIGFGGDNYVNKYNKNIKQITPLVAANKVNEQQFEASKKANETVYEQEMKLFADRTVDYEYLLIKEDFSKLKSLILAEVTKFSSTGISSDNVTVLYNEYERINGGVDIIKGGHLANAERREAYQGFKDNYRKLLASCKRLNDISKIVGNSERYTLADK